MMRTIRGRLTAWYAVALIATLLVFGLALYVNPPRPSRQELDRRTALDGAFAVRYLTESHRVLGDLVRREPVPGLDVSVSAAFEGLQSYVVVVATDQRLLYLSPRAREFDFATLERFAAVADPIPDQPVVGTISLGTPERTLRYRVVPARSAGPEIAAVIVATPVDATPIDPDTLLQAMLVVSPIVLLAAIAIGHRLAGTALRPVQTIIHEVEAITDGRSLHRRIIVPPAGDEMARLATTVNGMLARLEQSFVSLRRFTADASHELKTPLMVLRAGVERALTDPRTSPDVLASLDETLEEISRMSEMVESLLTLARADEGRAPLALETTDMRALMEDIAETAGILGDEARVSVATALPSRPVPLPVDPHRIRELLLNLVTNAIKYTPAGGSVHLELSDGPDAVAVVVRDTGIGIAPGDLPHIFDRFWRADPARSRTGERPGVGLGLAITKWIAEAHGGTIGVQSRPGRGTIFTVHLPKQPHPEPAEQPA